MRLLRCVLCSGTLRAFVFVSGCSGVASVSTFGGLLYTQ